MISGASIDRLADALFYLLYHRAARQRFVRGDTHAMALGEEDRQELETIDLAELEATAKTIARNMLSGNSGGGGGLRQSFPMTLALLEGAGIASMEAMYRFLEAPAFGRYRELPYAGAGLSAEEAFHRFLLDDTEMLSCHPLLGWAAQHEMLVALLSMLTVIARPAFTIETPLVRDNGCCRFACPTYPTIFLRTFDLRTGEAGNETAEVPYLYAATADHFIQGPVMPLVVALMEMETIANVRTAAGALAERHEQSTPAIFAAAEALAQRGLIR